MTPRTSAGLLRSAVAALALLAPAAASADYALTVLHTNDFHARFEPISKYDSGCSAEDNAEGKCFGGSARLATAVAAEKAASSNPILLDGGDQFQGTLFYTYYKGKAAAEMMNALGYDAMTVGNHEFDDGPEVLRGFMDAVDFPVLMSNADVSQEPQLADVLQKSTVVEKNGEKIGLIGLTPQDTTELASPGKNITFSDPVEAVRAEVEKLTAEGVNKIIVLSHSGYGVDQRVAAQVAGVDIIVGGHTNTLLSNTDEKAEGPYPTWVDGPDGGRTAVLSAYAYGKYLGKLEAVFDDEGKLTDATQGEPVLMDASIAEDMQVKGRIEELAEPLQQIREKVVAQTEQPIGGDRAVCRAEVCEMGVLVADAMLDRVKDQGIDVAIANGGGLRASIDAGEVTMGEVLTVLPFQNTLATFQLTGAGIVEALETGVSQVEEGAGRFPQISGMRFVWDPAQPAGSRIVSVEIGGEPLDPAKTYGVVSNNYMRSGGDGYAVFAEKGENAYDFGPDLADVVAEYLAANAPYTPKVDDRISRK